MAAISAFAVARPAHRRIHLALASEPETDFAPEPFTAHYQRIRYQSLRASVYKIPSLLRERSASLPEALRPQAAELLASEASSLALYHVLLDKKTVARPLRCHGDYHLGEVLYTGKDFIIIDFEGEPARPARRAAD